MITADKIKTIEDARMQLFGCKNKAEVEGVFNSFGISDLNARIAFLFYCMQVRYVYGAPGGKQTTENEFAGKGFYEETLDFFEYGKWRELV